MTTETMSKPRATKRTENPLDTARRIGELKALRAGWLDGRGLPLPSDGLDWLTEALDRHYPSDLPSPYLFPTAEGNVLAEWSLKPFSTTLEIDLESHRGDWHSLNGDDLAEQTESLDLNDPASWKWLARDSMSAMKLELPRL